MMTCEEPNASYSTIATLLAPLTRDVNCERSLTALPISIYSIANISKIAYYAVLI